MKKLLAVAGVLALASVWTVGPALAADPGTANGSAANPSNKTEGKLQRATDTVKEKAREAKDKIKQTYKSVKAKAESKTTSAADVRTAQQALKDKGYDPGPIDGKMGPRTTAALRSYQKAENLTVTGRADNATMAKLSTSTPSASPSTAPINQHQKGS